MREIRNLLMLAAVFGTCVGMVGCGNPDYSTGDTGASADSQDGSDADQSEAGSVAGGGGVTPPPAPGSFGAEAGSDTSDEAGSATSQEAETD